jgi:hypothetical protein
VRTSPERGLSQRVTHFSGRAIGEKTDGIHVFARGAGSYENGLALKIAAQSQHVTDSASDGFRSSEAAAARHTAGEITFIRIDNVNPTRAKGVQIFLRGRMLPHVDIHGGRDDNRRFGGKIQSGKKVSSNAVRELAENVSGGGCDKKQVDALRYSDVFDGAFYVGRRGIVRAEHFGDYFLPC